MSDSLSVAEPATQLAILFAAYDRDAPVMRRKNAPPREKRDEHRKAYAKWLAERMTASNLRVTLGPSASHDGR